MRLRSLTFIAVSWAVAWWSVLLSAAAWGMHDVDHRYKISGYVRDAQGQPVADARVIISATRLGEGTTAFTDRRGYYEAVLHLHDADLGEPITVTAGDDIKRITAQFNAQDKTTERHVEVNFGSVPAPAPARRENGQAPWIWPAVLAGAAVGVVSIVWYARKQQSARVRGQSSKKKRG
ncbi:MAG: carboxypeptidase-like regulatory domain-containing protein, partial [Nitrospirota bacterium]